MAASKSAGKSAGTWFQEKLFDGFAQAHQITKTLFQGRSPFQRVSVVETARYGRMLILDDVVQTTEGDEFVYHEMLTHLPMFAHGKVRDVLIIGGGDGGILEEVLKHKSVRSATMVEIDPVVIDVSKKHLKKICGKAFEDKRTNLVVDDGAKWVRETSERYDLIIVDRPDPVGPATVLFSRDFYANCRRVLRKGGIVVCQNGVPQMQGPELTDAVKLFRRIFPHSGAYVAAVPTYICGFMSLTWAADQDISAVAAGQIERRFKAAGIKDLRYYNPGIGKAAFALPTFVAKLLPR